MYSTTISVFPCSDSFADLDVAKRQREEPEGDCQHEGVHPVSSWDCGSRCARRFRPMRPDDKSRLAADAVRSGTGIRRLYGGQPHKVSRRNRGRRNMNLIKIFRRAAPADEAGRAGRGGRSTKSGEVVAPVGPFGLCVHVRNAMTAARQPRMCRTTGTTGGYPVSVAPWVFALGDRRGLFAPV